jgi:hypothetical protein
LCCIYIYIYIYIYITQKHLQELGAFLKQSRSTPAGPVGQKRAVLRSRGEDNEDDDGESGKVWKKSRRAVMNAREYVEKQAIADAKLVEKQAKKEAQMSRKTPLKTPPVKTPSTPVATPVKTPVKTRKTQVKTQVKTPVTTLCASPVAVVEPTDEKDDDLDSLFHEEKEEEATAPDVIEEDEWSDRALVAPYEAKDEKDIWKDHLYIYIYIHREREREYVKFETCIFCTMHLNFIHAHPYGIPIVI